MITVGDQKLPSGQYQSSKQRRKRRTRGHIISDLGANHVERYALKCGFSVERVQHDYGLDMIMFTYQPTGEIEDGFVNIQLKASEHIEYDMNGASLNFSVERAHLDHWLAQPFPVLLIIYDAKMGKAYWVYVQRYFERIPNFFLANVKKTYNIKVPIDQAVNEEAMYKFAEFKQLILNQIDGVISHA